MRGFSPAPLWHRGSVVVATRIRSQQHREAPGSTGMGLEQHGLVGDVPGGGTGLDETFEAPSPPRPFQEPVTSPGGSGKSGGCRCCHNRPRLPRPFTSGAPLTSPSAADLLEQRQCPAQPGASGCCCMAGGPWGAAPRLGTPRNPAEPAAGSQHQNRHFSPACPWIWDRGVRSAHGCTWCWEEVEPQDPPGSRGSSKELELQSSGQEVGTAGGGTVPGSHCWDSAAAQVQTQQLQSGLE